MKLMTAPWLFKTPLGFPVEPEVYTMYAGVSLFTLGAWHSPPAKLSSFRYLPVKPVFLSLSSSAFMPSTVSAPESHKTAESLSSGISGSIGT